MFYTKQVAADIRELLDKGARTVESLRQEHENLSGDVFGSIARLRETAGMALRYEIDPIKIRLEAIEKQLSEVLAKPVVNEIAEYEQPKRVTENDELEAQKQGA